MVNWSSRAVLALLFGSFVVVSGVGCHSDHGSGGGKGDMETFDGGTAVSVKVTVVGDGEIDVNGTDECDNTTTPCGLIVMTGASSTTVTAKPATGYEFTSWNCAGSLSTSATLDIPLSSGVSCTVTFTKLGENLMVTVTDGHGGTGGVVTSSLGGIACGTSATMCAATVDFGSMVTLTAVPDPFYTFSGWTGDCAGSTTTVDLVVDTPTTCTATFAHIQFPLTLSVVGAGTLDAATSAGSVATCNQATCAPVNVDTPLVVTLTATPASNTHVGAWSADCTADASSLTAMVTMDMPRTCVVTFVLDDRTLITTTSGNGIGTVAADPAGTTAGANVTYTDGTMVTLTATPDVNSDFAGWSVDCTGDPSTLSTTVTLDADKTCNAIFNLKKRTLTVNASAHGTVTSSPAGIDTGAATPTTTAQYDHGTGVTLTATPDPHYVATIGGDCSAAGIVTMDADKTCSVTFALIKELLTVTAVGSGSVTSDVTGIDTKVGATMAPYDYGTVVKLTAAVNTGPGLDITFGGWSGACAAAGMALTVNVTMDQARSCTATFSITPYNLTVTVAPTVGGAVIGQIGGAGPDVVNCGAGTTNDCAEPAIGSDKSVTLTAAPAAGYRFDKWSNCSPATTATLVVQMTNDKTCTANFVKQWNVTVTTLTGLGTVTIDRSSTGAGADKTCSAGGCTQIVDSTETVIVSAIAGTPATGTERVSALTCSAGTKVGNVYTLTSPTADTTCTVTFTQQFKVTVSAATGGTAAASCGVSPCTVDTGTSVTLTGTASATPAPGYRFKSWTAGTGGVCGYTTNAQALSITSDQNCVANFDQLGTVAVTNGTGGTSATVASTNGAPDNCAAGASCTIKAGLTVNLQATPAATYIFANWTGCATANATNAATTTVVPAGTTATCVANYTKQITVTFSAGTGGTASSSCGASPCTVNLNTNVTLTAAASATPTPGYRFKGWTGASCSYTTSGQTIAVTTDQNCTATFDQLGTVATADGTGGSSATVASTNPAPDACAAGTSCTIKSGLSVNLLATAATGYKFLNWTGCTTGSAILASTTTVVLAGGTSTCTANYSKTWNVTFSANTGGTVSSPCGASVCNVIDGTGVQLNAAPAATPAPGYRFGSWTAGGGGVCGYTSNNQTVSITSDRNCVANFVQLHTVTTVVTANGSVTSTPVGITACTNASCSGDFDHNAQPVLTATPATNYRTAFSGCTGTVSGTNPNVFTIAALTTNVSCNVTFVAQTSLSVTRAISNGAAVTATFDPGTVTSNAPANISCGTTCSATNLDASSTVQLTAAVNAGFAFKAWSGTATNCTGATTTITVTLGATAGTTYTCNPTWNQTATVAGASNPVGIVTVTPAPPTIIVGGGGVGTSSTVTTTTPTGYRFTGWSGACSGTIVGLGAAATVQTSNAVTATTATVNQTFTCVANFVAQHILTIDLVGEGEDFTTTKGPGSVTGSWKSASGVVTSFPTCTQSECTALVDEGATISLSATALVDKTSPAFADFDYVDWTGCAGATAPTNTITPTMDTIGIECQADFRRYWSRAYGTDILNAATGVWSVANDTLVGVAVTANSHYVYGMTSRSYEGGPAPRYSIVRVPSWGDLEAKQAVYSYAVKTKAGLAVPNVMVDVERSGTDGYAMFGTVNQDLGIDVKFGPQVSPTFLQWTSANPGATPTPAVKMAYLMALQGDQYPPAANYYDAATLDAAANNGYVLGGTLSATNDGETYSNMSRIIHIDKLGAAQFDTLFCVDTGPTNCKASGCESDTSLVAVDGNSGTLFGSVAVGTANTAQYGPLMFYAFFDAAGRMQLLRSFLFALATRYTSPNVTDVATTNDGTGAIVVGSVYDNTNSIDVAFAAQINHAGTFAWSYVYTNTAGVSWYPQAIKRSGDGTGYVIAGDVDYDGTATGEDGFYMPIDATGNPGTLTTYGSTAVGGTDLFNAIAIDPHGGVALAGASRTFGESLATGRTPQAEFDGWALRVRENGNLTFNATAPQTGQLKTQTATATAVALGAVTAQRCNNANVAAFQTQYKVETVPLTTAATVTATPFTASGTAPQQATQCGPEASDTVY